MRSSHSSSVAVLPTSLIGMGVHLPDRIKHRMIVGVEQVFLVLRVSRNVDLPYTMVRHVVQIIVGIEVVILAMRRKCYLRPEGCRNPPARPLR